MKSAAIRLARCLAGYLVAVIVSSQVALWLMMAFGVLKGMSGINSDLAALVALAAYFTAIAAALPATLCIAGLELARSRTKVPHALSGAATGFAACLLFFQGDIGRNPGWPFVTLCMAGGAMGGLAYWWVAGRVSGNPVFLRLRRDI
ncbi:MAG: hypothetical protein KDJ73_13535 [Notoacmeibacter sp.]|nr:hypothetical protein [Notoacmeibacter sp.]MCC0033392.1 hypothetical protein [Brucellaceae bacterium]